MICFSYEKDYLIVSQKNKQMKRISLLLGLVCLLSIAQAKEYKITDYGVQVDSTKLQTEAIQKVIDKASENGGGTIVIPQGVYLSGALFFKSHTKLRLQEGAVLKGSDKIENYPLIPSRMEGHNLLYYAALINAYYIDSFSIEGPGTINGNGLKFWKSFWSHRDSMNAAGKSWTNLEVHRPRLIFLWGCNDVVIRNATLKNSGFWTTHLYMCNNILIDHCRITSPFSPVPAPSTDGIDLDVCKNVVVKDCYISVNDDAIAIKGGKGPKANEEPQNGAIENVLIEDCDFGDSHGTLTLGSECIHARNIVLKNCKMNNDNAILRLKMRPDTYQVYEDITIKNITGRCGTLISVAPWKQFFDLKGTNEKPYGIVRNIQFENLKVKCDNLGSIKGNPRDKISNISFKNIEAKAEKPTLSIGDYPTIKTKNVKVNGQSFSLKK